MAEALMAINRPQKRNNILQQQKDSKSADIFIAAAEINTLESDVSLEPQGSMNDYTHAQKRQAINVIESYMPWAAAAGIMPIPALDLAASLAIQLKMLASIGDIYGVAFKKQAAQSAITSLMAGSLQQTVALSLIGSVKFIPIIGPLASVTILPAIGAAGTYALGRVYISHFESGGTFLNFDTDKMRSGFDNELKKAKIKNP